MTTMRVQRRRMPAEWEPHAATWVAWPHNAETWPGCLDAAEREFRLLVEKLSASEPVHVVVQNAEHARHVHEQLIPLGTARPIQLHEVPTDDAWMRDIGPTFVEDAETGLLAIDWLFNSWGGKYPPWDRDDAAASGVAAQAKVRSQRVGLVIEGGALEVDGEGTLLTTESVLLDPKRNPRLDKAELERQLAELLGVRHVVWLEGAIEGDDTDGHIDEIARFVGPARVVCAREPDARDPNHAALERCRAQLEDARDARGRALEVIDLPMPPPIEADGARLPASYANFYIANQTLIVPVFGVAKDAEALRILSDLFPGRAVSGTPCRTLVRGLGSVHCLTQQQPALRHGPES